MSGEINGDKDLEVFFFLIKEALLFQIPVRLDMLEF